MKRFALAIAAGALLASPALAQTNTNQGNGSIGNLLQGIGRSLNGQSGQAPASQYNRQNTQNDYQQTYNNSARQFRDESNQQLQTDQAHIQDAEARLRAASQALNDEMQHRGIASNRSQGFSGSSMPPGNFDRSGNGYGSYSGSGR